MILVTGATGKTGRSLVDELQAAGAPVRALVREPATADLPPGVAVVQGDLGDPASLGPALTGVDAVFLLWPVPTKGGAAEVIEAISSHARRIVYLSAMGIPDDPEAETDPILDSHRHMEQVIEDSGLEWTFVRSGGMAGNTLGWVGDIRADGVVREPFGGVPRPLVHERDLAAVAAKALTEGGHAGRRYEVTGPEIVSGEQQVRAIASAIDRPLRLEALDREQSIERLIAVMGDQATVEAMLDAWAGMIENPEQPTDTFQRVTGRAGSPYEDWARDHAADFS